MKPVIYLAARYSRREELCGYRSDLERYGYRVSSRWLNGSHEVPDESRLHETPVELRERFALEDLEDLRNADALIAFTEAPRSNHSRGGRHVEFGVAVGMEKTLIVVGPRENVFHCLPGVTVFPTWKQALAFLAVVRG